MAKGNIKRALEFYINGRLFKTCPYTEQDVLWETWDKTESRIDEIIMKKGYTYVTSDVLRGMVSSDATVYVNPHNYKCVVKEHKIYTGRRDSKGNKIYTGDKVKYLPHDIVSEVNAYYDREDEYYIRDYHTPYGTETYNNIDFKECVKVEDVCGFPKARWNKPRTITESEF